ncbi:helix-turn-helix transcriptional regulator [Proteiniborus sp. MB09-C3]|uniref:helix-turn-helix domain-containing protein n=1 Tax=Proteiniborus sp. MB09-C3 TaxID=3050072 RepID=UPI002556C1C9|nr:helix-turn-helix transcriptional regulator [Proteiniborus sp. MB09-C3]WIV13012.1 helix-turn-helix transcriptional regulator [Proteiniborus sp. MB09-C3]
MKSILEFGECLRIILSSLNMTYNQLARGINVDPSLVSRWVNNKRVPSYNSNHIQNIAKFISNSITNVQQKQSITEAIHMLNRNKKNDKFKKIEDILENILLVGQEYSIANKKNTEDKTNSPYFGTGFSEKEFILASGDNTLSSEDKINMHSYWSCNECVIVGEQYVLSSVADILYKASKMNGRHSEPILITLNNGVELFLYNQVFSNLIEKYFIKVLENDWKIVISLLLRDDKKSNIKTIKFIQKFAKYENFKIFYFKESSPHIRGTDVIIVPEIGAIVCLCFLDYIGYSFDSAFYFKNQKAINMLLYYYYKSIAYYSPLIVDRFNSRDIFFCKSKAENLNRLGNRYLYSNSIDSLTMPTGLYEKYLRMSSPTKTEFEKKVRYQNNSLQTFDFGKKNCLYKNIYIREDIENLIAKRDFLLVDGYHVQLKSKLDQNDIIEYINNIIYLLKKYDNYEIALISKKSKNILPGFCFETKGISSLLISTINPLENTYSNVLKNQKSSFSFLINEPVIVKSINDLFIEAWEAIPEVNKNKNNIIAWLENSLNNLL